MGSPVLTLLLPTIKKVGEKKKNSCSLCCKDSSSYSSNNRIHNNLINNIAQESNNKGSNKTFRTKTKTCRRIWRIESHNTGKAQRFCTWFIPSLSGNPWFHLDRHVETILLHHWVRLIVISPSQFQTKSVVTNGQDAPKGGVNAIVISQDRWWSTVLIKTVFAQRSQQRPEQETKIHNLHFFSDP